MKNSVLNHSMNKNEDKKKVSYSKSGDDRNYRRYSFRQCLAYFKITLLLTILWIFFSGNKDPLMISCGVIAIVFTVSVSIYTNIISSNSYIVKLTFFKYVWVLIRDVLYSSFKMVKIIYSEKLNVNPGTVMMNVKLLSDQEKVLFANLITMTPGTFVIAIEGDNFLIHALNKDDLEFKNNKEITTLLTKMRGNYNNNDLG